MNRNFWMLLSIYTGEPIEVMISEKHPLHTRDGYIWKRIYTYDQIVAAGEAALRLLNEVRGG